MLESAYNYLDTPLVFYVEDGMRIDNNIYSVPFTKRLSTECLEANSKNWVAAVQNLPPEGIQEVRTNFRLQAPRFFPKVLMWMQERMSSPQPWLIALDADTEFLRPISGDFYSEILDDEVDVVVLDRPKPYNVESGFMAFNLARRGGEFIDAIYDYYRAGFIYRLQEWTDIFVISRILETTSGFRAKNLVPPDAPMTYWNTDEKKNCVSNVWNYTPLAKWIAHYKGPRKYKAVDESHTRRERE
jgi:hypothetical protein